MRARCKAAETSALPMCEKNGGLLEHEPNISGACVGFLLRCYSEPQLRCAPRLENPSSLERSLLGIAGRQPHQHALGGRLQELL